MLQYLIVFVVWKLFIVVGYGDCDGDAYDNHDADDESA